MFRVLGERGVRVNFLITDLILRDYRGCSGIPFFVPYIEIINIYILLFTKIIDKRYAKFSSQNRKI